MTAYRAGIQLADFKGAPEKAVERINAWVNQETAGRIPQIVSRLDPDTGLVLANAIYFNAGWDKPFEESATADEPFHPLAGADVKTPMMHQHEHFLYTEGDGYQAIQLPYQGQKTATVVVLPAEGRFREIEAVLTGAWMDGVIAGLADEDVILTMPKFTDEPELSLDQTLADMGMPDAFEPAAADFSGIIRREDYYAWIGKVMHKAFIDVNEQRTEAAATEVEVEAAGMAMEPTPPPPKVMRMDRPFIYLIRDLKTGAILFVGRVMDPTK